MKTLNRSTWDISHVRVKDFPFETSDRGLIYFETHFTRHDTISSHMKNILSLYFFKGMLALTSQCNADPEVNQNFLYGECELRLKRDKVAIERFRSKSFYLEVRAIDI